MNNSKSIYFAILYFLLSAIITWLFVDACPLYTSLQQKLLSTCIAGAKWGLQIAAGYFFLGTKKWEFIKNIGIVCMAGSIVLLPYTIIAGLGKENGSIFFTYSLLLAVVLMIGLYFLNILRAGLPLKWFGGWLICLAIAITLQLTVVFSVIKF
ncbi:MAG: hypothetical protein ABIR78_10475 [Ferruginibacter sp.]